MLVWQGMPNGGDYDMLFVTELTNASDWIARNVTDDRYAWFVRVDEALYCLLVLLPGFPSTKLGTSSMPIRLPLQGRTDCQLQAPVGS